MKDVLKQMHVPPLRRGFVDDVLIRAMAAEQHASRPPLFARWELWVGALTGAAAAVIVTLLVLQPNTATAPAPEISLAFAESRSIDVLIDSERTLDDATVRIVVSGAVELADLDDAHQIQFQTRLERGRNMLSVPVIARTSGQAQLIATIEHEGRSRRIAVNVTVKPPSRANAA